MPWRKSGSSSPSLREISPSIMSYLHITVVPARSMQVFASISFQLRPDSKSRLCLGFDTGNHECMNFDDVVEIHDAKVISKAVQIGLAETGLVSRSQTTISKST